jgi:hypothetical protein
MSATGNVIGANINTAGLVTATGNVISTANVSGGNLIASDGVYGNIFTTLIDSADSSIITVTPDVNFLASVDIDQDLTVGALLTADTVSARIIDITESLITSGNITANNITANSSINIAGDLVATVDDATALAIALG